MGDSDDEYDKKRRDKFQGERTESYRNDRRKEDDWGRSRVRNDYRDRYQGYQDMPPNKRMRFEPGDVDTQPPIMTFKAFLQTQDDNITDEEAISKYAEYKMEFRRQQLNEFFVAHKEEEWFKLKYHPEESQKRKEEQISALKKRASVFLEMLNKSKIDEVRVDADQGDAVVKLLDSVVIRLEGGTDLDLQVLELTETPPDKEDKKEKEKEVKEPDGEEKDTDEIKEIKEDAEADNIEKEESKEEKEEGPPGVDDEPSKEDENSEIKDNGEMKEEDKKEPKGDDSDKEQNDEVVPLTPRPLHKTSSIFLRTISPRITKQEIETICKKYPGFLRVSLSDPQPEQHWIRRGWVTFRRDVNIKEICWNINNIRVKDCEMGAIVNRDLSRRVRSVSGLSAHKQVVLHDIKLCARIIQELDARYGLWEEEESAKETDASSFCLASGNPVLRDITEFLVEEAPAEEEELLGEGVVTDDSKNRHSAALKVLDRLLLYLRIVYSVDYYNMSQYTSEDEMPNRCGIMHLRGMPSNTEVSQQEINDYCESYKTKLEPLVRPPETLSEAELTQLGAKSEEAEVEKFIQANTQELAKDKWLCPLSGKKFKGAQFVRKHIFNKYSDQLDEVKKEVDYFNNYLRDPKRPQLAEHPGNRGGKKDVPSPSDPTFHYQYPPFKGRGFGHFGGHPFARGRGGFPRGRSVDYRPIITYRDLDAPSEPDEII
ncbi:serrate RNA effector molecule homolog isoform X2 [Cimex lectularius]|uniref:Serrate RNA effector molecule homolog n=1 Tax=Cimex lectularius TaxID=79782 RepID=A0A8I6SAL8_CIMLE|nr:serrate RNA effector molecule homolog isoform X2 [Cimex lectularius]